MTETIHHGNNPQALSPDRRALSSSDGLLEEGRLRYRVIASNCPGSTADVLIWYRQRGRDSENRIKELKIGWYGRDALWSGERLCRIFPDRRHCP